MRIVDFENSFPSDLSEIIQRSINNGDLIPFLGAGFSRGSRSLQGVVPNGSELQDRFIELIATHSDATKTEYRKRKS